VIYDKIIRGEHSSGNIFAILVRFLKIPRWGIRKLDIFLRSFTLTLSILPDYPKIAQSTKMTGGEAHYQMNNKFASQIGRSRPREAFIGLVVNLGIRA